MTGSPTPNPEFEPAIGETPSPPGATQPPIGMPQPAPGAEAAPPPRPSSLPQPLSSTAVLGTGDLSRTPMHYGEPLREQRALAERGAIVDLPHVRVLTLTGADRLTWLNSITTQKIDTLAPGVSTETLVLDPNGRIEGWLRLVDDGETLWALSDFRTDETLDFLNRMVFMMRVEISDVSDEYQAIGAIRALPEALPVTRTWADPWPHIGTGSASYAQLDLGHDVAGTGHPGLETPFVIGIVARTELATTSASEFRMSGFDSWEALRVAAWRPGRNEIDHKSLVGELDLLRTSVHLAKGCYRGQEAVARVHNLGQPPRRLVFVHLDGSGHIHPDPGAEVLSTVRGSQRPVGELTSVAQHYELGPIGLAVIKRTVAPDAELSIDLGEGGIVSGAQEIIVSPSREHDLKLPGRNKDVDMRNQHR